MEHHFRRAYAIATATLAPDHPFVATSSKNLHDFCAARGRPVELPPISSDYAGEWQVEVRSEDGTVPYEERFTVR